MTPPFEYLSFLGSFLKASRLFAGTALVYVYSLRVRFSPHIKYITCQDCTHASPRPSGLQLLQTHHRGLLRASDDFSTIANAPVGKKLPEIQLLCALCAKWPRWLAT